MVKFQFSAIVKGTRPSLGEEVRGLAAQKPRDPWVGWS